MSDVFSLDESDIVEESAADAVDTCACPFCGQSIKRIARKCRHCGELLGDPDAPGLFRDGKNVVLSRVANLGPVCVKTNEPADQAQTYELSRRPGWILLLLLLGPFFFIVALLLSQKKVRVRIPLSHQYMARRRRAIALAILIGVSGGALIVGGLLVGPRNNATLEAWLIAAGMLLLVIGVICGAVASSPLTLRRITDDHIWLRGFHPEYIAKLPVWSPS